MSTNRADIIIIGGGMVGLTTALALAETELNILVLDNNSWPSSETEGQTTDLRVSAITRASQNIFRNLGCWDNIVKLGVNSYEKMHVWDELSPAGLKSSISFDAADIAQPDLGHIVENKNIRTGIWQTLKQHKNITLLAPVTATKIQWNLEGARGGNKESKITLDNGDSWRTKLLIGADGANSWLRDQYPIKVNKKPYQHDALVCNIKTEKMHQSCAWQRFLKTGPLALLPLKDPQQCSIVWSTSAEQAEHLKSISDEDFNRQLTEALDHKLGSLEVISKRVSFPLIRSHVERYVDNSIALVGDAAHTIHPLAGQGVNLGLLDAGCLAEVLIKALDNEQNIAMRKVLRPYERWRKSENQLMLDAMGFFRDLYDGSQDLKVWPRNLGMKFANDMPLIKKEIIQRAMGIKGDLPVLAKTRSENL